MKPRMLSYNLSIFHCVVIFLIGNVHCDEIINSRREVFDRSIATLHRTVDFMARRPEQLNVDAVFGLTLLEANLKQALDHQNVEFFDRSLINILSGILDLAENTRRRAKAMITKAGNGSEILNQVLNRPEIWMRPIVWTFGILGPRPSPGEHNTRENVADYLYRGTPREPESDSCITQLADDSIRGSCQVSDRCADMLLRDDQPRGYPLTHRLLYVQVAIALGCEERRNTPFKKLIPTYCAAVLQDAIDFEDAKLPSVSRDMICEQVILCGMEGYTEFTTDHYTELIMSWQNSHGCYSGLGFSEGEDQRSRSKRESDPMDYACDNHATSLAATSLSLLIRHSIEILGSSQRRRA